ncbi:MAG: efflux transporter outer membrane subunit [Alphaproteobacteria bacterium]|nr:efflux transporter outer membrane subunit [Alphaproteobacteria bacterium]MBU1513748.1 efflux transporter outer membrane subunit [Alphaproteobacteria bacterium]MBU2094607.1 efflux transporter outer membrane subunit [Alphaproteobacteria bacterium]MBU2150324.1 efflux transporter outer membrane subunit [Alphaproteobacteria bacterium]MBU2309147.1 efflux transporter outer membrane subunit [Alphaproteobacteria bacterium]
MRRLVILLCAAALGGCTLEPAYVRPMPAAPTTWPVGAAYPQVQAAASPSLTYVEVFRDPRLKALIDRSLTANQDLAAALANVEIARAQYRVQRAEELPHLNATASASEDRARGDTTRDHQAGLELPAFQLDLFGRLRSLSHAAQEAYLASDAGARMARLTLVGDVADAWLTLAADRSLLSVADDTEASARRTVDLTQVRLSGGVAPRSDLSQAQTVLDQALADQAQLTSQVAQDRNALQLLVGGPVADAELPASIEGLDASLAEVPAGLDSHILLGRPDVEEAEHRLKASFAEIGAARAAFFPTINLTALAGVASPELGALFSGGTLAWQGQAAASLPLFAGGANAGGLALAKGERDLAVAQYQKAIQAAFRDVADALARRGTIDRQLAAQASLEAAANESYTLSLARYREGVDPYLSTLDAQRTLYAARRALAATRLAQAQNLVALYESLGGDPLVRSAS